MKREHGIGCREEDSVSATARQVFHLGVGLSLILLKRQR